MIYGRPYSDFATESFLSAADAIFYGASENAGFADDIEGIGDINGDDLADFAIGAYLADYTGTNRGLLMTMLGGTYSGSYDAETVASFMLRGQSNNHRVGQGIARAGDRNGDGLEDFWVGSYGFNSYAGAILLFEGRELN